MIELESTRKFTLYELIDFLKGGGIIVHKDDVKRTGLEPEAKYGLCLDQKGQRILLMDELENSIELHECDITLGEENGVVYLDFNLHLFTLKSKGSLRISFSEKVWLKVKRF